MSYVMKNCSLMKKIFFSVILFSFNGHSKSYDDKTQEKSELIFKIFYNDDRKLYHEESGFMFRKTSPIDDSYYYYKVDTILKQEESINLVFEFFPPSTLMFKKDKYNFETLACWNN